MHQKEVQAVSHVEVGIFVRMQQWSCHVRMDCIPLVVQRSVHCVQRVTLVCHRDPRRIQRCVLLAPIRVLVIRHVHRVGLGITVQWMV